jgi:hypothetical protein
MSAYRLLVRQFAITGEKADALAALNAQKAVKIVIVNLSRRDVDSKRVAALTSKFDQFCSLFERMRSLKAESAAISSNQVSRTATMIRLRATTDC